MCWTKEEPPMCQNIILSICFCSSAINLKGIEMLVNMINVAYCAMKMLPYQDEVFSKYRNEREERLKTIAVNI